MKRIISLVLTLVMLLGMLTALTSCGAPEDAGAEIAVYLGQEIYDFDPTEYYVNNNAETLMGLLYEPLFRVNEKGKLECAAAKKYEVDEENRTITVELRETYWSDEVRVKAEDYVYAWRNRVLVPNRANPAAALFYDIENALDVKRGTKSIDALGAVATGIYEITITYREGADYKQLLKNLASVAASPARQDIINTADAYWTKIPTTIVTNGPFKIEDYSLETKSFTVSRNMGYHQKSNVKDYTKNVTPSMLVSFIGDDGATVPVTYEQLSDKTVFYMLDASLADRLANKTSATVADDLSTYTYVFNTDNELFKIPEVRRALSLALDRNAMANAAVFAKPAESFVSASIANKLYADKALPISSSAKINEARTLLESVSKKLEGLELAFELSVNNDEESIAIANLAKNAWRELGFDVTVIPLNPVVTQVVDNTTAEKIEITDSPIQYLVKAAAHGKRDYDVIAVDWQMYSNDAFVALASLTSSMNGNGKDFGTNSLRTSITGWWNTNYDTLIQTAFVAKSPAEREEALRAAEKVLLESAPIIPVLYNQNFSFQNADISGVKIDGFGNFILTKMEQLNYQQYLEKEDAPPADDEDEEGEE